jgi:hypothetical protein
MIQLSDTASVQIRPVEPVKGVVRVDFHYSNGEETGIARETAFLRLEDRTWASPVPYELMPEELEELIEEYNLSEKVPYPYKRTLYVHAVKQPDGTFNVGLEGEGFDDDALRLFLDALRTYNEVAEDTFMTFPVVRELEDPELMAELDRRIQAIKDGTAKLISADEMLAGFQAKWALAETVEPRPASPEFIEALKNVGARPELIEQLEEATKGVEPRVKKPRKKSRLP